MRQVIPTSPLDAITLCPLYKPIASYADAPKATGICRKTQNKKEKERNRFNLMNDDHSWRFSKRLFESQKVPEAGLVPNMLQNRWLSHPAPNMYMPWTHDYSLIIADIPKLRHVWIADLCRKIWWWNQNIRTICLCWYWVGFPAHFSLSCFQNIDTLRSHMVVFIGPRWLLNTWKYLYGVFLKVCALPKWKSQL